MDLHFADGLVGRMRDGLALLAVCVVNAGGTADELANEPSAVEVSLLGVETDL